MAMQNGKMARAKYKIIFVRFLLQMKTLKFAFEIY